MRKMIDKTIKQFVKFSIVGVSNTLINLLVLFILTDFFHVYYIISAVFAFIVAVTNSFILNTIWTFKEKIKHKAKEKYVKFFIISVLALLANLLILYAFVEYFNMHYLIAQIIGIINNVIINFFGNKLWTFKNEK